MNSRRNFIGNVASSLAVMAAPGAVLGANDRIRVGIIGAGARGLEITRDALACPNIDFVAFSDIYTARLEAAKQLVPAAKTYLDHRYLLEDKSIDAVLIATPQHLHCQHFVDAMEAGKHVYQEKTMAFTVDHAKLMRDAYKKAGNRTVQIGHQGCSSGQVTDAMHFLGQNILGQITAIEANMYRNTPQGKPQWSRPVFPDMTEENILWSKFLGDAPQRDFDANRYTNWRYFWDYSGGNVHENLCNQLSFWYKCMDLQIPKAVTMVGGVYLWKDGREVPDTMNVSMQHLTKQSEDILFSWSSGFGNSQLGAAEHVLGTHGTIVKSQQIRYIPQSMNRPKATEIVGQTRTGAQPHMQNFFDSIRSGHETNCSFDIGFRVSIACRMAVESYRQGRTVRWDSDKEEIV